MSIGGHMDEADDKISAPGPVVAEVRKDLRTPRSAGVAGLVFALLFSASLLLARPPSNGSPISLSQWWSGSSQSTLVIVGLYEIPFAGIAFLWFIGVVRDRVGEREDRFFSTVFLGSGLLFVAMLFTAAACATALALRADTVGSSGAPSPSNLQFSLALTYVFLYVYAARAAGVFMIVTSTIVWRTHSVPNWIAFVGFPIALLLLLSIRYFRLVIMLFPLWVALVSIFVLFTPRGADIDDEVAPSNAPNAE